jgi:hypothetical protein
MKHPFAPLVCAVMAHIKPKNQQSWDVHADTSFNIRMAMEHQICFQIYIVKFRATRVSSTVFFKHQYTTNPQVTLKTLVIKAALEVTSALKGMVSCNGKMAEALEKFSKLFMKIVAAKAAMAKAKDLQNNLETHLNACQAVPLPRVVNRLPILASPLSRVPVALAEADSLVRDVAERVQMVETVGVNWFHCFVRVQALVLIGLGRRISLACKIPSYLL